jgi:hypothetical protein
MNKKMINGAKGIDLLKLVSGTRQVNSALIAKLKIVKFHKFLTGFTASFRRGFISLPHLWMR